MIFNTRIAGIPAKCEVLTHSEGTPMRITGWGFGDAEPPEPPEFEYRILDSRGRPARWLEDKVTDEDDERLEREYLEIKSEQEAA